MIWVVPIAGKGTRTQKFGEFKPFIDIRGHKILEWFISSIKKHIKPQDWLFFITTNYFAKKYKVKSEIKKILISQKLPNKFYLHECRDTPQGISATVYLIRDDLPTNKPITIINPDQYIDFEFPFEIKPESCYMAIYSEFTNKSGFVEIKAGKICRVVEKINVSNLASAGVLIFPNKKSLTYAIEKQFTNNLMTKGEYYLAPSINYLIEAGYHVFPLSVIAKYDLGCPNGIKHFSEIKIGI